MLCPFAINWSSDPVLRLEWKTEVQISKDDTEFVTELRTGARRTLRFETVVGQTDAERVLFENILLAGQGETFQLPWWPQQLWLTAPIAIAATSIPVTTTTGREFSAGDAVALIHYDQNRSALAVVDSVAENEIVLTAGVAAAWPVGTKLVRVFDARLKPQQPLNYLNDRVLVAEVEFNALQEWQQEVSETADYLGLPILQSLTDASENLTQEVSRNISEFDNETGKRDWFDISGYARRTRSHRFVCDGMEEVPAFFNWLAARRGRANSFWLPTQQHDIEVTANITSGATQILVKNTKHTLAYKQPGRNHLFIKLKSGTVYCRKITALTEVNSTTERITMNSALGTAVAMGEIEIVCYLQLMRLSSDAVEVTYKTDECITCNIGLTAKRDD